MSDPVTATGWASLTSADLLVSLRVPVGWDVEVVDEAELRLQRDPRDAAPDGTTFGANLGIRMGEPEEPGEAWFDRFCDAVPGELAATGEQYELIGTERFRLSSAPHVLAVTARQHMSGLPATSQLLAYVWANSYRMYVVDAVTLREHETRDLPVFGDILRSVRVLPSRN